MTWRVAVFFACLGLLAASCRDGIPAVGDSFIARLEPAPNHTCGWMQWSDAVYPVSDWFLANPEHSALHWWDADNGEFQTALRSRASNPDFVALRPQQIYWRDRVTDSDMPTTAWGSASEHLIEMPAGVNLIPWNGAAHTETSFRDIIRWLSQELVTVRQWDASMETCRRYGVGSNLEYFELLEHLDQPMGSGDLLAIELDQPLSWTQSWHHHARFITFGNVGVQEYAELRQEVSSVTGYFAVRHGIESDVYNLILLESLQAFREIGGRDLEGWPRQACGIANNTGIILLMNCDDPIAFDHEYVHLLQYVAAGRAVGEPKWFLEGMAEYLSARYRDARRHETYTEARSEAIHRAAGPMTQPLELSLLEGQAEWDAAEDLGQAYAIGWLAVEWLASQHGDDALFDFMRQFSQLSLDAEWPSAFASVFGTSVAEFYDAFVQLAPEYEEPRPHLIHGQVASEDGAPVQGLRVYAYPFRGGGGLWDKTNAGGAFSIKVGSGEYYLYVQSSSRCTGYGALQPNGTLGSTTTAQRLFVNGQSLVDVDIRIPGPVHDLRGWSLCPKPEGGERISGIVLNHAGDPLADVGIRACETHRGAGCAIAVSQSDGTFSFNVPHSQILLLVGPRSDFCRIWGARTRHGGLTLDSEELSLLSVRDTPISNIEIRLDDPIEELESVDACW